MRIRGSSGVRAFSGAIGIFLLWELLHVVVGSEAVPAPIPVVIEFSLLLFGGSLWMHFLSSLARLLAAIVLQLALGTALGIWLGMNRKADAILGPVVYALFPVPKIAFLPVFMILFGLGDISKIALLATVVIFQTVVASRDGVRDIPKGVVLAARSLKLEGRKLYAHVILPAVAPRVFSATRLGIGTGMAVLFFAENYATRWGIGYFIMNSYAMADYVRTYSGILGLSLMGLALFALVDAAERRLCAWSSTREPKE